MTTNTQADSSAAGAGRGGRWAIAWKSDFTGYEGQGTPVYSSESACQERCDSLNKRNPGLHHWPVRVEGGKQ